MVDLGCFRTNGRCPPGTGVMKSALPARNRPALRDAGDTLAALAGLGGVILPRTSAPRIMSGTQAPAAEPVQTQSIR